MMFVICTCSFTIGPKQALYYIGIRHGITLLDLYFSTDYYTIQGILINCVSEMIYWVVHFRNNRRYVITILVFDKMISLPCRLEEPSICPTTSLLNVKLSPLIMITISFIPPEMIDIRYISFFPCEIEMDALSIQLEYISSSNIVYSESIFSTLVP